MIFAVNYTQSLENYTILSTTCLNHTPSCNVIYLCTNMESTELTPGWEAPQSPLSSSGVKMSGSPSFSFPLNQQQAPSPTEPLGNTSPAASTSCFSDIEGSRSPDLMRRGSTDAELAIVPDLRLSATHDDTTSARASRVLSRRTRRNSSGGGGGSTELSRTTTTARSLQKSTRGSTSQAAGAPASPLAIRNHESLAPSSPSSSSGDFWLYGNGKHGQRGRCVGLL